jgi:recombination protein RecR
MYSPSIKKLIEIFSKFPTVGPRTAARFVFYLIQKPKEEVEELIDAISHIKKNVKNCSLCFNAFESEGELCPICLNNSRNKKLLCVVASETDLLAIEKIRKYNGLYFIFGGTVSALKKADVEKLRVKELEERIKKYPEVQEIILAISSTAEGEATTLYLERLLKPYNIKITRLGRGLPVGGELEYADEETLSSALECRKVA